MNEIRHLKLSALSDGGVALSVRRHPVVFAAALAQEKGAMHDLIALAIILTSMLLVLPFIRRG